MESGDLGQKYRKIFINFETADVNRKIKKSKSMLLTAARSVSTNGGESEQTF